MRKLRGFTLLETVTVAGIMAFAIGALAVLYVNFNTVMGTSTSVKATAADASRVVDEAELLVRASSSVLASYTFLGTPYSSGPSTLVLELPSVDSSGNVLANTYDRAVIYQTGSTTTRILAAASGSVRVSGSKKLAGSVSSLSFAYDNASYPLVTRVDVEVRTVMTSKGKSQTGHQRAQLYLHNRP